MNKYILLAFLFGCGTSKPIFCDNPGGLYQISTTEENGDCGNFPDVEFLFSGHSSKEVILHINSNINCNIQIHVNHTFCAMSVEQLCFDENSLDSEHDLESFDFTEHEDSFTGHWHLESFGSLECTSDYSISAIRIHE